MKQWGQARILLFLPKEKMLVMVIVGHSVHWQVLNSINLIISWCLSISTSFVFWVMKPQHRWCTLNKKMSNSWDCVHQITVIQFDIFGIYKILSPPAKEKQKRSANWNKGQTLVTLNRHERTGGEMTTKSDAFLLCRNWWLGGFGDLVISLWAISISSASAGQTWWRVVDIKALF